MKDEAKTQSLLKFCDKVAYVVTDLNGLISSIVNQEITEADLSDDLTELFDKLSEVEGSVSELANLFWSHDKSLTREKEKPDAVSMD